MSLHGLCQWNCGGTDCDAPRKPYDMHAPFDAPIRAQKAREEAERKRIEAESRKPGVRKRFNKMLREAWAKTQGKL